MIHKTWASACVAAALMGLGCGGGSSTGGTAGTSGAAGTTGAAGTGTGGTTGTGGQGGTGMSCTPLTKTADVAVVTGPAVGAGRLANSALRKAITATDTGANPAFRVDGAWVVDPAAGDSLGFGFIALTNRGSTPACDVRINNVTYRDAAGTNINTSLAAGTTMFVMGADSMQCTGLYQPVSGCLAPGDSSWGFLSIAFAANPVSSTPVASVDFTIAVNSPGIADAQPDFNVAVQSYTVDPPDANRFQILHATVKNQGTKAMGIGAILPFFLLDEQGVPVYYSAFNIPSGTAAVSPGQSITLDRDRIQFDGSATRIHFVVQAHHP